MTQSSEFFVGGGGASYSIPQNLRLDQANRHGFIAGATGTGKTVTLQILAERFCAAGVPVFLADVKGDLAGLAVAGSASHRLHGKLVERASTIGLRDYAYEEFPVTFWDVFGESGHPIRATITEMGPLLLSRMLDLSEAQEGVINIAFRLADDEGLLLLDLKDLRSMLSHVGENARELRLRYGTISSASIGAIQRRLLVLENQGITSFFGEPALQLSDLMRRTPDGRGMINILAADRLMHAPRLYATVLLWLLSELFETLPELGDPAKPELVFFFDEAHLLFRDAPAALIAKVEQVARLIRSKGVGVFFVTQKPDDIPEAVLSQLGNRVQHALRAYTPRERRALKAAAESFRPNPEFDTAATLPLLGVGEALGSFLDRKSRPGVVERTLIRPPSSQIGPISTSQRRAIMQDSGMAGRYDMAVDRDSAFENLAGRAEDTAREEPGEDRRFKAARVYTGRTSPKTATRRRSRSDSLGETLAKTVIRTAGSQITRSLVRGVLGGLFKGR